MTPADRVARALAFVLAAALHSVPLLDRAAKEQAKQPPPPVDVSRSGDVELLAKEERELDPAALHVDCPQTYEGIGIRRNVMNRIVEVAPGWPAHRAGILPGDQIDPWNIDPVDGFMEFQVTRNGKRVAMRLKTEKICFRDGPF